MFDENYSKIKVHSVMIVPDEMFMLKIVWKQLWISSINRCWHALFKVKHILDLCLGQCFNFTEIN